jgi:hypothetical protein
LTYGERITGWAGPWLGIEDKHSSRCINDLHVWFRSFRVKLSRMRVVCSGNNEKSRAVSLANQRNLPFEARVLPPEDQGPDRRRRSDRKSVCARHSFIVNGLKPTSIFDHGVRRRLKLSRRLRKRFLDRLASGQAHADIWRPLRAASVFRVEIKVGRL